MVTMAQRIEQLRTERNLSRPALSTALGFSRMAIEKFESGRQTPSQEQQQALANYFGVSLFFLRGESDDKTQQSTWVDSAFTDDVPIQELAPKWVLKRASVAPSEAPQEQSTVFDAFLTSKKFKESLCTAVLDTLRSSEGQELLAQAIRKELARKH